MEFGLCGPGNDAGGHEFVEGGLQPVEAQGEASGEGGT
jgi:hypothetical protein